MKNFIAKGESVTVAAAPYDVLAGAGCLVGTMFGVAVNDALTGAEVVLNLPGIYELTKIGSQAWTVGARVYWDDTNKRCTTVSTSNTLIGVAVEAVGAGAGETLGKVRLNGSF